MKKYLFIYSVILLVLMLGPQLLLIPVAFLSTLAVPVYAGWNKQERRRTWRIYTLTSCLAAILLGIFFAFFFTNDQSIGFPFPGHSNNLLNKLLNFSLITCIILLPLSASSTYETWKRNRSARGKT